MTTDNRTKEPTEAQVEAAWDAYALTGSMRAALVAAQGAAPQTERVLDAAGNEAQKCLRCSKYVAECCESFAPVLPSSGVDEDALAEVIAKAFPGWANSPNEYPSDRMAKEVNESCLAIAIPLARAVVAYLRGES